MKSDMRELRRDLAFPMFLGHLYTERGLQGFYMLKDETISWSHAVEIQSDFWEPGAVFAALLTLALVRWDFFISLYSR